MPNSPSVKFSFENNNVQASTPLLGVSCLLARTTKGPYDDPSELLSTYPQFQRVYGSEIVPDGSVSNIEKALNGGSKLRIIRVLGKGATKGVVEPTVARMISEDDLEGYSAEPTPAKPKTIFKLTDGTVTLGMGLVTKGYGDPIGSGDTFKVGIQKQANSILYTIYSANGSILENGTVVTYKTKDANNLTSVDYLALSRFKTNSQYIEPVLVETHEDIKSWDTMINWLTTNVDQTDSNFSITLGDTAITNQEVQLSGTIGNAGGEPTADEWVSSLEALKDYVDVYQFSCSHIHQHLEASEALKVHQAAAQLVKDLEEYTYYVEVPKSEDNTLKMTAWVDQMVGSLGNSKYISYFGGGLKYYNYDGNLQDSDVMGTIIGLGDASASAYGPWKSFAGMNRGLIPDGKGPVCQNYGSPSRYQELNKLAQSYINVIVVKDTRTSGKQTMLWHNFTSQVKQDSERFLSIVRLNLYIKKNLRPILENYIEEPNIWNTWKDIYLEVKPLLDSLVDQDAMSEYTWIGDQDASSYSDLSVNNEADVRQGKYKAVLKYKDIVAMQDITINVIIDSVSKAVSISENE